MEKDIKKTLDDFIGNSKNEDTDSNPPLIHPTVRAKMLDENDGLIIERLDHIIVDSTGRQLLREVY